MRTVIIVQARMRSTRLPGKVLLPLNGHTVLDEVLSRCRAIPGADDVVCAVPDEPESEALVPVARRCGALIVRGAHLDVLARYQDAARAAKADIVMRVTSDCPLIDPAICGEVLALRARAGADYASNNLVASYPHGLDCEAFTAEALARACAMAGTAEEREHVTPWLRREPGLSRVNLAAPDPAHARERWTLDHPEDYAFLQAVFAALARGRTAMADVLGVLAAHPEFHELNWHLRRP